MSVRGRPSGPKRDYDRRTTRAGGRTPPDVHAKARLTLETTADTPVRTKGQAEPYLDRTQAIPCIVREVTSADSSIDSNALAYRPNHVLHNEHESRDQGAMTRIGPELTRRSSLVQFQYGLPVGVINRWLEWADGVIPPEVVNGVLVNAISGVGRILVGSVSGPRSRRTATDLDIARWFDTYQLIGDGHAAAQDLSPEAAEQAETALGRDEIQAVLQELLAARLTDAPETDIARIRSARA